MNRNVCLLKKPSDNSFGKDSANYKEDGECKSTMCPEGENNEQHNEHQKQWREQWLTSWV